MSLSIIQGLKGQLNNKATSDIRLVSIDDDDPIHCHKVVLSLSSAYFSELIESDTHAHVLALNFKRRIVYDMLQFIYSDVDSIVDSSNALELMIIAHTYRVHNLFNVASEFLSQNLNLNNCLEYLSFSIALEESLMDSFHATFFAYMSASYEDFFSSAKILSKLSSIPLEILQLVTQSFVVCEPLRKKAGIFIPKFVSAFKSRSLSGIISDVFCHQFDLSQKSPMHNLSSFHISIDREDLLSLRNEPSGTHKQTLGFSAAGIDWNIEYCIDADSESLQLFLVRRWERRNLPANWPVLFGLSLSIQITSQVIKYDDQTKVFEECFTGYYLLDAPLDVLLNEEVLQLTIHLGINHVCSLWINYFISNFHLLLKQPDSHKQLRVLFSTPDEHRLGDLHFMLASNELNVSSEDELFDFIVELPVDKVHLESLLPFIRLSFVSFDNLLQALSDSIILRSSDVFAEMLSQVVKNLGSGSSENIDEDGICDSFPLELQPRLSYMNTAPISVADFILSLRVFCAPNDRDRALLLEPSIPEGGDDADWQVSKNRHRKRREKSTKSKYRFK